jgi:predicted dinucleotide-utilizing enzyme
LGDLADAALHTPDLIIEVSHPIITTNHGADLIAIADYMVGSPTVFADPTVETAMRAASTAQEGQGGHGLYIPAGAMWGAVDIQKMSERGSLKSLKITMKKHPSSFKLHGKVKQANETAKAEGAGPCEIYLGPVRQLCPLAPNNVNTMAAAAMAAESLGFDNVVGCLVSDSR